MAFNIFETKKKDLVILGIGYFTRKIFEKSLKSKKSLKTPDFIKKVHTEF
ncbi:hypothetical protein AAJ76_394000971 [Vairimorpha ceranae]|uniref:Uncharacterized protein n=1 Tax=Vairimorpha ceranae TaxID=40302 RepID=A0A0F9WKC5_9MICR|nr:hypothetical protein AAJ76_394000971 [Vairimorpha ceranae]KKO73603.1 hypothetical protein AAJ76_394000971 [Vairimorpha ceranae]